MPSERKTEPPTAARLRRARRDGDHPVSEALIALGALAAFAAIGALAFEALLRDARELLSAALRGEPQSSFSAVATRVIWRVAPVVGVAALGAFVVGLWQTGGVLSAKPLAWSWQRLTPGGGSAHKSLGRRVFSVLSLLCIAPLLGACGWQLLRGSGAALAASVGDASAAARLATKLCGGIVLWALPVMLALAVADTVLARNAWYTRLRMSREEVEREQREREGDAGIKRARQRAHQELSQAAGAAQLEGCALLVLGSARLAVALAYDPAHDAAPRVLIRASGQMAKTLEALAPAHAVPIHHDPALARGLAQLDRNEEIPKSLYAAVSAALKLTARPSPDRRDAAS